MMLTHARLQAAIATHRVMRRRLLAYCRTNQVRMAQTWGTGASHNVQCSLGRLKAARERYLYWFNRYTGIKAEGNPQRRSVPGDFKSRVSEPPPGNQVLGAECSLRSMVISIQNRNSFLDSEVTRLKAEAKEAEARSLEIISKLTSDLKSETAESAKQKRYREQREGSLRESMALCGRIVVAGLACVNYLVHSSNLSVGISDAPTEREMVRLGNLMGQSLEESRPYVRVFIGLAKECMKDPATVARIKSLENCLLKGSLKLPFEMKSG